MRYIYSKAAGHVYTNMQWKLNADGESKFSLTKHYLKEVSNIFVFTVLPEQIRFFIWNIKNTCHSKGKKFFGILLSLSYILHYRNLHFSLGCVCFSVSHLMRKKITSEKVKPELTLCLKLSKKTQPLKEVHFTCSDPI